MMLQVLIGRDPRRRARSTSRPGSTCSTASSAFLTVGLAYSYRRQMRGRRELFYGLVGLFIMGLGIRAVLQATGG